MIRGRAGAEAITSKGGRDLVTGTDVAAEDAVRRALLGRQAGYPVVGEERGGEAEVTPGRPYWLVDPICGTRNFASDVPLYCVNVALVEDGQVTVAAVGDGGTGDRYVAELGQGAQLLRATRDESPGVAPSGRPLRASDASVTLALGVASASHSRHDHAAEFVRAAILGNRWYVRMLGTTLSFVHLAAGRVSAYLQFRTSGPVHTAAGCLVAQEAGALVTDLEGHPWDLATRAFLAAATPELHRDLLAMAIGTRPAA